MSNGPKEHDPDDGRRAQNDEIDLRYRFYEVEVDDEEEPERIDRRVADGWATETEPKTAWWLKAGIALVSIFIVLGLLAGLAGPFLGSFGSDQPQRIEYVPAQVVEVIDMRTIIVEIDGETATVRYIGVEPLPLNSLWYDVGFLANQQLVANSEIVLEADGTDTDDFGRLLRYVYANNNMVNGLLIRNGIALPGERSDGLDRHYLRMQDWSEAAKLEGLGHWSNARPQFLPNGGATNRGDS